MKKEETPAENEPTIQKAQTVKVVQQKIICLGNTNFLFSMSLINISAEYKAKTESRQREQNAIICIIISLIMRVVC